KAIRSGAFQERERPCYSRANLCEPESIRLNVKRRDGPKRLPPREQTERVLRRAETLFRNQVWCVFLQYLCPDSIHSRVASAAALDRSEEHTSELQSRFDLV